MKPVAGTPEELLKLDLPARVSAGLRFLAAVRTVGDYSAPGCDAAREEIEGAALFALFQTVVTKKVGEAAYESHEKYWDVQYLVEGEELIRTADFSGQTVREPYDAARDIAFFELGEGLDWRLLPGMALVIPPGVLHAPCLASSAPRLVRKVVVKAQAG